MVEILDKYKSLEVIYYSDTKLIYQALNIDKNEYVVLKLFKKDSYYKEDFNKLKDILKLSNINDNNNLTSIHSIDTCIYNNTEYAIIECEYLEGETLDSLLDNSTFNEAQGLEIMKGIISGLSELHSLDIIYRNLNCKNIYLDKKGFIKLDTTEYISTIKEKEEPVDASTDISLLGTVFYKIMTKETINLNDRPSYIDKERFSSLAVSILEKSIYQDILHKYKSLMEFLIDIKSENNYLLCRLEEYNTSEEKIVKKKNKYTKYIAICTIIGITFYGLNATIINKNKQNKVKEENIILNEEQNLEDNIINNVEELTLNNSEDILNRNQNIQSNSINKSDVVLNSNINSSISNKRPISNIISNSVNKPKPNNTTSNSESNDLEENLPGSSSSDNDNPDNDNPDNDNPDNDNPDNDNPDNDNPDNDNPDNDNSDDTNSDETNSDDTDDDIIQEEQEIPQLNNDKEF